MKIIYSWDHHKELRPFIKADIEKWRELGYDVTEVTHRDELGINTEWPIDELDRLYRSKYKKLLDLYDKVRKLTETHDVFIVAGDPIYHPEFVKSLKNIYTVIVPGDDPESSNRVSKPYVHAFDHSFASGVNFDKNTKITEKFLEWGAKRADWWPYGLRKDMYNSELRIEDIYNRKRDIDLVYVGTPGVKVDRIAKIKEAFPRMKIYGRGWDWKLPISQPLRYKRTYGNWDWRTFRGGIKAFLLGLRNVKKLPMSELVPLYQRCKIGINIHWSFGPSNVRNYQLSANGVMQICDCPESEGQVFKVGKEVVVYRSIEEAIELIKYYLEHDEERKRIAAAGFKRAIRDYKRIITFSKAIEKIKKGMLEEGIIHFKDGTSIKYDEKLLC